MNIRWFFTLFLFSVILHVHASDYWQQHVKYKIRVTLDDVHHQLEGTETITYTNNSPDVLDYIVFNLWANAFSTKKSPFNQQKIRTRSTTFQFAKPEEMGGYLQLSFETGGRDLEVQYLNESKEIAKVMLDRPLASGASITLKIHFKLKIPYTFSRLGHVSQSYQMTQWYPKPAVYDIHGWHGMPYLDLGEFYSEFGQYDVEITLPSNYVVGATGTLLTESEKAFRARILRESLGKIRLWKKDSFRTKRSDTIPPSSSESKTIRYVASQVHDFAWFADKRFMMVEDRAKLPSGKTIPTYGYFTPGAANLWQHSAEYVKDAVEFFSQKIGEYPWPHASAVLGPLSAGGGMEYPMITIIAPMHNAKALDLVINHEVGHNWYYGILASNERDHAWMDEGMNSYIDGRYARMKYDNGEMMNLPSFLKKGTDYGMNKLLYAAKISTNTDQPGDLSSDDYLSVNYQASAYTNPQMNFDYLEKYVGTEQMDKAMHHYFDKWKFKHPYPQDVQQAYEEALGKDLSWLFEGLMGVGANPLKNPHMDYALTSWKDRSTNTVRATNRGDVAAPVLLQGIKDGKVVKSQWFEGFSGQKELRLGPGDFDKVALDFQNKGPDCNPENQTLRTHGWAKYKPLNISYYGIGLNHSQKLNTYLFPSFGWNRQDGVMAGVLLHNITFPVRPWKYYIIPMYGFRSRKLVGLGDINYNFYPRGSRLRRVRIGLFGRRFTPGETSSRTPVEWRVAPYLGFRFKRAMKSMVIHDLRMAYDQYIDLPNGEKNQNRFDANRMRIRYEMADFDPIQSNNLHVEVFRISKKKNASTALTLSYYGKWQFAKKQALNYRFFQGYFLHRSELAPKNAFYLTYNNEADYLLLDDYYLGRKPWNNYYSKEIKIGEGGFKDPIPVSASRSLTSLNLSVDIPKVPFTKLFLDQAIAKDAYNSGLKYYMSTGIAFEMMNTVALYFPLYNVGLDKIYDLERGDENKWLRRVSFMFKYKWDLGNLAEDMMYLY